MNNTHTHTHTHKQTNHTESFSTRTIWLGLYLAEAIQIKHNASKQLEVFLVYTKSGEEEEEEEEEGNPCV